MKVIVFYFCGVQVQLCEDFVKGKVGGGSVCVVGVCDGDYWMFGRYNNFLVK